MRELKATSDLHRGKLCFFWALPKSSNWRERIRYVFLFVLLLPYQLILLLLLLWEFLHLISKYPLFSSSFFFWNHSYFSFFRRPLRFFLLVHHRYFYCRLSLLPSVWPLTPALAFAFFLPLILLCSDSLTFLNSPSFSSCLLPKYTHSSFLFCSVIEWHVQGLFCYR